MLWAILLGLSVISLTSVGVHEYKKRRIKDKNN